MVPAQGQHCPVPLASWALKIATDWERGPEDGEDFLHPKRHGRHVQQDIGMVDPECVVEPVHAIVLLQQPLIGDTQEADVLLVNATIPDVI